MYGQAQRPVIDWRKYRPTRLRVFAAAAILLTVAVVVSIAQFSQVKDNTLPAGAPLGGDYVAFLAASEAMHAGQAGDIYAFKDFDKWVDEVGPPIEKLNLLWQYPPTYYFIVWPLVFFGFAQGYVFFTGVTAAGFFASLRAIGADRLTLFVVLASTSVFHAVITGQNGFLTATLALLAAYFAKDRPIVAGLAAALLTVKPQLGVLLPIAFIAGGCWRAFFVAAAGTTALVAMSLAAFGADIWLRFYESLTNTSEKIGAGVFPVHKMPTPFAAAMHAGLPAGPALAVHGVFALCAAALVAYVWRRVDDQPLRAAILLPAIFLVAPYAYYYEMVIMAPAIVILAQRAIARGWLPYEQAGLAVAFAAPLFVPAPEARPGLGIGLVCVLIVLANVLRRIDADHPLTFAALKRLLASRTPAQRGGA